MAKSLVRTVAAMVTLSAAACTGSATSSGLAPNEPDQCAGPSNPGIEDVRRSNWQAVRAEVERGGVHDVWVTFGHTVTPRQATAVVGDSEATGVLLAYRERQGTTAKTSYAPEAREHTDVTTLVESAVARLEVPAEGPLALADPGRGVEQIAGVRIQVTSDALGELAAAQRCLIWAMAPGSASATSLVSPEIESP